MSIEDFVNQALNVVAANISYLEDNPHISRETRDAIQATANRVRALASRARSGDIEAIEEIFHLLQCHPGLKAAFDRAIQAAQAKKAAQERRRAAMLSWGKPGDDDKGGSGGPSGPQ